MKLLPIVKKFEGNDNVTRLRILKRELKRLRIPYTVDDYNSGENIVVEFGNGKPLLFVTHHDAFPGSPGANDNGSALAVLLAFCAELKQKSRAVKILFFGEEEWDCVGSRTYVDRYGAEAKAVIDLELVGHGDMIAVWPVIKERPALTTIRTALRDAKIPFGEVGTLPMFYADYLPFREEGLADAWCISVVPSKDEQTLRSFATAPTWWLALKGMVGLLKIPELFKHYHNKSDTSDFLSEDALQLGLRAVRTIYGALR